MAFIADVFDVTLIDNATGEAFATTTLQDANIEVSVEENEIRGGKGNQLLGLLHVSRDINIGMTDAEFKYEFLAMQLGTNIKTGAGIAYAAPRFGKLDADKSIALPYAPAPVESIRAFVGEVPVPASDLAYADGRLTFTGDYAEGDEVEVRTYTFSTPPSTQTIEFDAKKFAKGVTAILETVEIGGDETITHTLQYIFPSAIPTGNFTISTSSAREAATQEFNLRVTKPKNSTIVGELKRFPYVDPDAAPVRP